MSEDTDNQENESYETEDTYDLSALIDQTFELKIGPAEEPWFVIPFTISLPFKPGPPLTMEERAKLYYGKHIK